MNAAERIRSEAASVRLEIRTKGALETAYKAGQAAAVAGRGIPDRILRAAERGHIEAEAWVDGFSDASLARRSA